jgi:lysozyme
LSTPACKHLIGLLAVAGMLTSAGAVGAGVVVAMSGGSEAARAFAVAESPSRPVLAAPVRKASPAPARAAARASRSPNRTLAAAATKPPVVDGVRRSNVGAAHSPRLSHELSGGPARMAGALPAGTGARGIDVAGYQHPHGAAINWAQVARAGYKFAFIKASEGTYYANPYYATDLAHAKAAGLYVTGYAFAVPNVSGGASQADYSVKHARYAAAGRAMPLALDIEYNPYGAECYGLTPARMVGWISAFTAEARRLTGQRPIIYTTADWWRSCTRDSRAFGSDPLWVAAWGTSHPAMPPGWRDWTFWQYTSRGRVAGISGRVDVSYFGRAAVRLLDPGDQQSPAGTAIRLQVRSLRAAAGQPPAFTAAGLPRGLSISHHGLISGTISAAATGGHAVTVTARTPSGGTDSVSFTWTVTGQVSPPPSPAPTPSSPTPTSTPGGPTPTPSPGTPAPPSPASTPGSPAPPAASSPPPGLRPALTPTAAPSG